MEEAIQEFKNYTSNYLEYGEMITLKINHTLRVVDLCEKIAKSLNMSDEEIFISKIIGLLHDIGRFEQWKRYHNFKDYETVDHADLGIEILKENNYLRKYMTTAAQKQGLFLQKMKNSAFFRRRRLNRRNIINELLLSKSIILFHINFAGSKHLLCPQLQSFYSDRDFF